MKTTTANRGLCLFIAAVLVIGAGSAWAGRDCDAASEGLLNDVEQWNGLLAKIEGMVGEHSKVNARILKLEASALEHVTAAAKATTDADRRQAVDEFKMIGQELDDLEAEDPAKSYYENWQEIQKDFTGIELSLFEFVDDCPIKVRKNLQDGD